MTPTDIVEKQVLAYNSRNLEDFANCHHLEVELYHFSDKVPFALGRENLKAIYKEVFENSPNLHTKIVKRISLGNVVIDKEIITGRKGIESQTYVAIYEIRSNLIFKAHFIKET